MKNLEKMNRNFQLDQVQSNQHGNFARLKLEGIGGVTTWLKITDKELAKIKKILIIKGK